MNPALLRSILAMLCLVLTLCVPGPGTVRAAESTLNDAEVTGSTGATVARNFRLVNVPVGDGLADHLVRDVLQDREGFIWIGTAEGLYRYDGYRTIAFHYSRSRASSLSHDSVTALYLDSRNQLWVGTQGGGLNRFISVELGFEHYGSDASLPSSLSSNHIRSITEDAHGQLWVGTNDAGLNVRTETGFVQYRHNPELPSSLPHDSVASILEDKSGNLWVGTDGGGLARFDKRSEEFVVYRADSASQQSISSDSITRLYEDQQERLWVATRDGGLNLFDRERQTFSAFRHQANQQDSLSSNRVHDVLLDAKGTLWVATHNGLNEMQPNGRFARYYTDQADASSLRSNRVYRLQQDIDGVMWIGTHSGLNRWNYISSAFNYFDTQGSDKKENRVTAVAESAAGEGVGAELWVGTKAAGLVRLDLDTDAQTTYRADPGSSNALPHDHITALHLATNGELWVGTGRGGAALYQPRDDSFLSLEAWQQKKLNSMPTPTPTAVSADLEAEAPGPLAANALSKIITVITEDNRGRIWIGTRDQGLLVIDQDSIIAYNNSEPTAAGALIGNHVLAIYAEPDGPIWVSTKDGGLNRFDDQTNAFTAVPIESDRGTHAALDITSSKDGTMWLGTSSGGLLRWPLADRRANSAAFTHYSKDTGLLSNRVSNILEDQNGMLWLSSNRGLSRLDPATGQTRHFDRFNGLRGDQFYAGAKLNSRSGQLYLGSSTGLLAFYPNRITPLSEAPRVVVQASSRSENLAQAFNNADEPIPTLELQDVDGFISFRFAALNFVSPSQNQYQYRLQGFDPAWLEPSSEPIATYTSLAPGDYRFDVRAANPEGVWAQTPASISLTVHAPWWRSATALTAYAVAAVGLIAFFLARLQLELGRTRTARRTLETQVELRTVELEERNRQLIELNDRLQEASITDPLTGLLNRRSFYEFVSREVASVERGFTNAEGGPNADRRHLFFMMIDLDGFKPINDTFGHHTGDHTLVQVSDLLSSCAREADTVFRWGGDEFLIIGQVQQSSDLEVLAERFRSTIANHRFDPKFGKALRLSASIGLAPYPFCENNPGIATWEQVADIADLAACLAKTHGKNAWVCARGTEALNTQALHQVKDRLDILIESKVINAVTSTTEIPIPGASQG